MNQDKGEKQKFFKCVVCGETIRDGSTERNCCCKDCAESEEYRGFKKGYEKAKEEAIL